MQKKANIGFDQATSLFISLLIIIVFMILYFSFSFHQEKSAEKLVSEKDRAYTARQALFNILRAPVTYQGQTIELQDFISYTLADGKTPSSEDKELYRTAIKTSLHEPSLETIRVYVGTISNPSYVYGQSPSCIREIVTRIPLAYTTAYKTIPITLEYTKPSC